jgi:hypothetical protein
VIATGPCAVPGCPWPATTRGRCAIHASQLRRQRRESTRSWRKLRQEVIDRAGGLCERCRIRPAVDAHHLDAVGAGGPQMATTGRLAAVCETCHTELHRHG